MTTIRLTWLIPLLLSVRLLSGVEITEFVGGAHAFPALFDSNGKKLADGDFSQWVEDDRLHVRIVYRFSHGGRVEENDILRQKPELTQEEWSWREMRDGQLYRQFTVNFKTQTATAEKRDKDGPQKWSEKIEVQNGHAYAGFGFALALQNLRPRLLAGEHVELQAIGFSPKPQAITVELSHAGSDEMKMSDRSIEGDRFIIHPKIPVIAKLFVKVPDTIMWLTKPAAVFLRLEGPLVEPNDPVIRVDLLPGAESGPAKPVTKKGKDSNDP